MTTTFHWVGRFINNVGKYEVNRTDIGRGIYEYYLDIEDIHTQDIIKLRDIISSISLYPLDLSMIGDINVTKASRIINTLKLLLPKYFREEIDKILTLRYSDPKTISFIPINEDGNNFYASESEKMLIIDDINLQIIEDLTIISTSPLVWNAIERINVPALIIDNLGTYRDGAYVIFDKIKELDNHDEEIESIRSEISKMKREGYFSYCNDQVGTKLLANEISSMFNITNGEDLTESCLIFKDKYLINKRWLEESVGRIIEIGGNGIITTNSSKLPIIRVIPFRKKLNTYYLQYIVSVAYLSLCSKENVYMDYISEIKVFPDLSVCIPIFSLNDLLSLLEEVNRIDYSNVIYKEYNSVREGLEERINISITHSSINTLLLRIGEREILYYPSSINIIPNNNIDRYRELIETICPDENCIGERYRGSELVFRGFLPYDILNGILLEISGEIDVKIGTIAIVPDIEESSTIAMDIEFGIIELVTVNNKDLERVVPLVEQKWRKGWFFTDWAKCYYRETNKISYSPIKRYSLLAEGRWKINEVISLLSS